MTDFAIVKAGGKQYRVVLEILYVLNHCPLTKATPSL